VATQVLILFDDHDVMMNAFTTKERKKKKFGQVSSPRYDNGSYQIVLQTD
jgi:hypothetical protein